MVQALVDDPTDPVARGRSDIGLARGGGWTDARKRLAPARDACGGGGYQWDGAFVLGWELSDGRGAGGGAEVGGADEQPE